MWRTAKEGCLLPLGGVAAVIASMLAGGWLAVWIVHDLIGVQRPVVGVHDLWHMVPFGGAFAFLAFVAGVGAYVANLRGRGRGKSSERDRAPELPRNISVELPFDGGSAHGYRDADEPPALLVTQRRFRGWALAYALFPMLFSSFSAWAMVGLWRSRGWPAAMLMSLLVLAFVVSTMYALARLFDDKRVEVSTRGVRIDTAHVDKRDIAEVRATGGRVLLVLGDDTTHEVLELANEEAAQVIRDHLRRELS